MLPATGITVLLIAYYFEANRRRFFVWFADNAKQGISSAVTHGFATAIAVELRNLVPWVNECDWYLMVFLWDTILGCLLSIELHKLTAGIARSISWLEFLARIGEYEAKRDANGDLPPSTFLERFLRWFFQMLHWVLCCIVGRLCVFFLLYLAHDPLGHIAILFGYWACGQHSTDTKVWTNVVIVPLFLDSTQYIVQNFWLKAKKPQRGQQAEGEATNDGGDGDGDNDGDNGDDGLVGGGGNGGEASRQKRLKKQQQADNDNDDDDSNNDNADNVVGANYTRKSAGAAGNNKKEPMGKFLDNDDDDDDDDDGGDGNDNAAAGGRLLGVNSRY